ncbi:Regulator of G-protein signaling loco [Eumeta japonica]|uniref:Regulator of G-protein signaling loco n=1 Tax=Eumeta variegata TaxID=151549 RepID=A0A4C1TE73_EUMVA|nr:Regulator of G-protein signaling loco [Eumeta japonica]
MIHDYEEGGRGRLECRVVVGYLGTIESPHALAPGAELAAARHAVRRLRYERRVPAATAVLLVVTPAALALRRAAPAAPPLARYPRERLRGAYADCGDDAHAKTDARHFALLTRSPPPGVATGCHVFMVDEGSIEHQAHAETARRFGVTCTLDPISGHCLEFPASAAYVVDLVRCMYSLPAPLPSSVPLPLHTPAPRSPQPSNHSERTTGSSNSDSGIGFHNECTDVAERILVVEFGRAPSAHYDPVYTDSEGHHYETIGPKARTRAGPIVGGLRRAQASLDDMLLARDDNFLHPASVGARAPRRGPRPSASAGDVCAPADDTASAVTVPGALLNASSAPDLRPPFGASVTVDFKVSHVLGLSDRRFELDAGSAPVTNLAPRYVYRPCRTWDPVTPRSQSDQT